MKPTAEELQKLWDHCEAFFRKQEIGSGETVYQTDRVIENAYEFIDGIGEIIGWYDDESDQLVKDE